MEELRIPRKRKVEGDAYTLNFNTASPVKLPLKVWQALIDFAALLFPNRDVFIFDYDRSYIIFIEEIRYQIIMRISVQRVSG